MKDTFQKGIDRLQLAIKFKTKTKTLTYLITLGI